MCCSSLQQWRMSWGLTVNADRKNKNPRHWWLIWASCVVGFQGGGFSQRWGEQLLHLRGAQSRTAATSHQKKPAECFGHLIRMLHGCLLLEFLRHIPLRRPRKTQNSFWHYISHLIWERLDIPQVKVGERHLNFLPKHTASATQSQTSERWMDSVKWKMTSNNMNVVNLIAHIFLSLLD